jgi:hypothetical protein
MSCGPAVEYAGRSYAPTSHVDIYFHTTDVIRNYEIIGKADGKAWLLTDYDKIRKSIVKEAGKKGADGVIFTGIHDELVNTSKYNDSSSAGQVQTVIEAIFIRYK